MGRVPKDVSIFADMSVRKNLTNYKGTQK
jgi:hypothetical protein